MALEAISRMERFEQQNLCNTAWAFANLDVVHQPLFAAISASAMRKIS